MLLAFHSIDFNALNYLEQVDPMEGSLFMDDPSQVSLMVEILGLMILGKLWHLKD